jgi:hypothetical protein
MKTSKAATLSPEQRARICERIRHQLDLEFFNYRTAKREAWARIAIGLPPISRAFHWEPRR